jgi:hypothetical protein
MHSSDPKPMSALERIAYVGWRHRFDEAMDGGEVARVARTGPAAMMHMLSDVQIRSVELSQFTRRDPREFVWGGFIVREDGKVGLGEIVLEVDGREVGRIVGLDGPGGGAVSYVSSGEREG